MTREEKLQKLLELMGNTHSIEDILSDIQKGYRQSFDFNGTWVVTEIMSYPRKKVLEVLMVCGELDQIDTAYAHIVAFAKEQGCDMIRAFGRLGWHRTATKLGFKPKGSVFTDYFQEVV